MEGILAYMISDLVRHDKVADEQDLKKMIWTIVVSMNLGDYVKAVMSSQNKSSHLACFHFYDRSICLYLNSLEEHLDDIRYDCKELGLSSKNTLYVQNLSLLKTCMHEVCHAYQLKQFHKKFKYGMQEKILSEFLSFFARASQNNELDLKKFDYYRKMYLATYKMNPLEIQADQIATNMVLKVMDFSSIYNPVMRAYFKQHLHLLQASPYMGEEFPLKKIAMELGHYHKLKRYIDDREAYQSLSLEEKLMYRFPLNKQEKDELNRKAAFTKRKLHKKN